MLKLDDIVLTPSKALVVENKAVISDLHLGFENVLQNYGINIPRIQIDEIIEELENVLSLGIEELIINGDVKHEFSQNLPVEWKDVINLLEFLSGEVKISIIRGNHDNFLPAILKKFPEVRFEEAMDVNEYTILHGHKKIDSLTNRLILGHEHPAVKLRDEVGGFYRYSCFLKLGDVIVLPAFSPLMKGTDMLSSSRFMSPILENFRVEDAEVYAIEDDVIYLGKIGDLRTLAHE